MAACVIIFEQRNNYENNYENTKFPILRKMEKWYYTCYMKTTKCSYLKMRDNITVLK